MEKYRQLYGVKIISAHKRQFGRHHSRRHGCPGTWEARQPSYWPGTAINLCIIALRLAGARPVYVYPQMISGYGIQGRITAEAVAEAMDRGTAGEGCHIAKPQLLRDMQRYIGNSRCSSQARKSPDRRSGSRRASGNFQRLPR